MAAWTGRWLVAGVLSVGCATAHRAGAKLELAEGADVPAPAPWGPVDLRAVVGEPGGDAFAVEPVEALGRALLARLGTSGGSVGLRVEKVRAVRRSGTSADTLLGLAAEFVLTSGQREERLALEHSLNYFAL